VAGGISRPQIVRFLKKLLPRSPPGHLRPPPPCFTNTRRIIYSKNSEAKNTSILISFHISPLHDRNSQMYFPIINDVLGGPMSSLLMRILRLKLKLIYGLSLDIETFFCGTIFTYEMSTEDKNIKTTIVKTMQIIKRALHTNIDERLIENIKNKHLLRVYEACSGPADLSSFYAIQYMNQLYQPHIHLFTPSDIKKAIRGVTADQIRELLVQLFHFSTCIIGYQGKKKISLSFADF
jgi:predicted Zn-dependent peptidase